jgi:hypothetical protein
MSQVTRSATQGSPAPAQGYAAPLTTRDKYIQRASSDDYDIIGKIYTDRVVMYTQPRVPFKKKAKSISRVANMSQVRESAYSGDISMGAYKRLRNAVDLFCQRSKKRIIWNPVTKTHHPFTMAFITLTISSTDIIPHREAYKKGLRMFLQWMRRQGAEDYIYKAELQERGQIHWHITINQFIRYDDIAKAWNRIQKNAGWLDGYYSQHGHYNAPSTQIKGVKSIKHQSAYLVKYVSKGVKKGDPAGRIDGKVWDCSTSLNQKLYAEPASHETDLGEAIADLIVAGAQVKALDQCDIILGDIRPYMNIPLYRRYCTWLSAP